MQAPDGAQLSFLSSPAGTVPAMSCTVIPDPLRDLLATVAAHSDIPLDQPDPEHLKVAVAYGWVYEYRGRVGLTGAGAWHAGVERRGGLHPGQSCIHVCYGGTDL